jgi:regulator of sirC expression with transglutaminase-like and TPR domain
MAHNVRNISDEQLNATSWLDENFSPQQGRLYNPTAAWCAHNLDTQPIFTVTLEKTYMLIAAHIQGDPVNGKNFPRILSIDTQKPGSGFVNVFNGGVHIVS